MIIGYVITIPRTMMMRYMEIYISKLSEKPSGRKRILTLSKPENKINELWPFMKKQIDLRKQIFWVCPLIEEFSSLIIHLQLKDLFIGGKIS